MGHIAADNPSVPRIAITTGDPNGIGPEVAIRALAELRDADIQFTATLVGAVEIWKAAATLVGFNLTNATSRPKTESGSLEIASINGPPSGGVGTIDADAGKASMQSVASAIRLCLDGTADAMVTAPISKEAIQLAGYDVPGHTEFIRDEVGAKHVLMLMVSDDLRVAVATGHQPISTVARSITPAVLREKLDVLFESLTQDFGIARPSVAIMGLNPHAGDGGVLGHEEIDIIIPLVKEYVNERFDLQGPFPADGFFGNRHYKKFDAVLATYHDQGLIPFKTLTFNNGVNFTAGLPIVRTSPDHGTAFDIAGQGIASASSMVKAIREAIKISLMRSSDGQ